MTDDLLAFVQALDAADEEAIGGTFSDTKRPRKQPAKPVLTASGKLSLDDLDFAESNIQENNKTKKKRKPLEVPLAPNLRLKVEQEVAYEESKRDVNKWAGVIRENREREKLVFPATVPRAPEPSILDLAALEPKDDFERKYLELTGMPGSNAHDCSLDAAFPLNKESLERDVEAAKVCAKKRSEAFFRDRKAAHQARIKSKKYRKMVARERAKQEALQQSATDRLISRHDPKRKEERARERARERLTLRTRKANQWASELLLHRRSKDPVSRQEIMEQVRAKDILRREIMGKESESESEEDIEAESGEIDDLKDITGDVSEHEEEAVGRISFKPTEGKRDLKKPDFINEDFDEPVGGGEEQAVGQEAKSVKTIMLERVNRKLAVSATARSLLQQQLAEEHAVPAEFTKAKEAEMAAEAPKTEDLTLAGWGSWTGPLYANAKPRVRVTKSIPGVDVSKRKDARLSHVIITEKRANTGDLEADRVPFPYTSREEYERALDIGGLGPEWNTRSAFLKKTARRVTVRSGHIIAPVKVKSTSTRL